MIVKIIKGNCCSSLGLLFDLKRLELFMGAKMNADQQKKFRIILWILI